MNTVVTFVGTLVAVTCYKCGLIFGLNSEHRRELIRSHDTFYCPAGHGQHYYGESKEERLARELEQMRQSRDYHAERLADQERISSALRGVITRTKRRVGNGVCPCCKRTFRQLAAHMEDKHPYYAKKGEKE